MYTTYNKLYEPPTIDENLIITSSKVLKYIHKLKPGLKETYKKELKRNIRNKAFVYKMYITLNNIPEAEEILKKEPELVTKIIRAKKRVEEHNIEQIINDAYDIAKSINDSEIIKKVINKVYKITDYKEREDIDTLFSRLTYFTKIEEKDKKEILDSLKKIRTTSYDIARKVMKQKIYNKKVLKTMIKHTPFLTTRKYYNNRNLSRFHQEFIELCKESTKIEKAEQLVAKVKEKEPIPIKHSFCNPRTPLVYKIIPYIIRGEFEKVEKTLRIIKEYKKDLEKITYPYHTAIESTEAENPENFIKNTYNAEKILGTFMLKVDELDGLGSKLIPKEEWERIKKRKKDLKINNLYSLDPTKKEDKFIRNLIEENADYDWLDDLN